MKSSRPEGRQRRSSPLRSDRVNFGDLSRREMPREATREAGSKWPTVSEHRDSEQRWRCPLDLATCLGIGVER